MSDYPSLTEMDVKGFNEITHYSVQAQSKDRDVLRINYKRKKGSLLPNRKTFKFGRSSKMVRDSNSPSGTIEIYEISPFLQKVMTELDSIIGTTQTSQDKAKALLEQIEQLEKDMQFAIAEMKATVKDL